MKLTYLFNRRTPFKAGFAVIFAACAVWYSFGYDKPFLLSSIDNRIHDQLFRIRGPRPVSQDVVIVDIDEASLKKYGQWPWPRDLVADLIRRINRAGPVVIGMDIVFSERDQTTPAVCVNRYRHRLGSPDAETLADILIRDPSMDHDLILGDAIADGNVVAGYFFLKNDDKQKTKNETPFPSITIRIVPETVSYADIRLESAYRAVVNIDEIATARSEGFFNVFPDPGGTVRKVPLFISMDTIPYPSLAFEVVRVAHDIQAATIHVSKNTGSALKGVSFGQFTVPTDARGNLAVNHRGPVYSFPYLSAADILNGDHNESLQGRIVLIGSSATGIGDLVATPFSSTFPGVEVQAAVIDNIISKDIMVHDIRTEIGLTYVVIVTGGLLMLAALVFLPAIPGSLAAAGLLSGICVADYLFFFKQNQLVGIVYILFSLLTLFITVTVINYFYEGRRRRFIRHAFSHYIAPSVIHQLLQNPDKLKLEIEKKEVTVFFSDIRGFTPLAEQMPPEELGQFLNRYLTVISDIIMTHGGMVDKYIGDAVMAVWGIPVEDEAHASRAVSAAIDIRQALASFNLEQASRDLDLVTGIGINTGPVLAGNFGSQNRFDYTVVGDHVNLASRLEALNKTYGVDIIVSEYTLAHIRDKFFSRCIDTVMVKGKTKVIDIFEIMCKGTPDPDTRLQADEFSKALAWYRNREFTRALARFEELNSRYPSRLYQLYTDRTKYFLTHPPPRDWNGVFKHRVIV